MQRPGYLMTTYEDSTAEENSPLGWETVMRNIKRAGDSEFKKHARRFYVFEGILDNNFSIPLIVAGAILAVVLFKK